MKKTLILIIFIAFLLISMIVYSFNSNNKNDLKEVNLSEVAHSIFYSPQYVAIEKGYFKDEGLDIKLTLANGANNVMASLLSGDSDIGLSGSEATIYVYNKGEKDYYLASIDNLN